MVSNNNSILNCKNARKISIKRFKVGDTTYIAIMNIIIAVVQTKSKAPDPIRTPKLSDFRRG